MCPEVGHNPTRSKSALPIPLKVHTLKNFARCLAALLLAFASLAFGQGHLLISQIYGGGGNTGAVYSSDYVELYNPTAAAISLSGYSIQYASASGTSWQAAALPNVSVAPAGYFLIKMTDASGKSATVPSDFNASPTINMSATTGKVALSSTSTALSGTCPLGGTVVDFVGFGTASCSEGALAPAPANATALSRSTPPVDTDNNSMDFTVIAPAPHNSSAGVAALGIAGNSASFLSTQSVTLTATVTYGPATTSTTVTADLSSVGGSASQPMFDDGTNGDATAGDKIYSYKMTITSSAATLSLPVKVVDNTTATASGTIALTVAQPGVAVRIYDIQGAKSSTGPSPVSVYSSVSTAPTAGVVVETSGIVTGIGTSGFFIQDPTGDGNPATPDGIYVYSPNAIPTGLAIGNTVTVTGKITTYPAVTASHTPATELNLTFATITNTGVSPLPAPVVLTSTMLKPGGGLYQMTPYEGMRVSIASLTTTSGTDSASLNETAETYTSNGQFYAVITGTPRPFREPGIDLRDPVVDASKTPAVFDDNPERILVDTTFLRGTAGSVELSTGAVLPNVTGVLDMTYSNDSFYDPSRLLLDVSYDKTTVVPGMTVQPIQPAAATEFTVASFNIERFYNPTQTPTDNLYYVPAGVNGYNGGSNTPTVSIGQTFTSDAVNVTPAAYTRRLQKLSLAVRNVLNLPDIITLEEVENQSVANDIANQINTDAGTPGLYAAYSTDNSTTYTQDGTGISVGFLVKTTTVDKLAVTQFGQGHTFTYTGGTQPITLNDRPWLVLSAGVKRGDGAKDYPVTVIANHMKALTGVNSTTSTSTRQKKELQAEDIAKYIQSLPAGTHVISGGDFNAFEFSDGYTDTLATYTNTNVLPANQVVQPGVAGLVTPPLTDLALLLPADQRWSYVEYGNAQILDHLVVTPDLVAAGAHMAYAHLNADFPTTAYNDATTPARTSDHDVAVGYFTLPPPVAKVTLTPNAPPAFGSIMIGATSTQGLVLTNTGEAPLTITSAAVTGDFAVTNNCGTSLPVTSSCNLAVTFKPTLPGTRTGVLTVVTSAGTTTTALTGVGVADFTLSDTTGKSTTTVTLTAGTPTTVGLTFTSLNSFSGTIALSCTAVNSVFAPGLSCTVPATFTLAAGATSTQTVTLTANPRTLSSRASGMPAGTLLGGMLTGLALLLAGRLRKARLASVLGMLLIALVATSAATGCSDSSNLNPLGTPAGTYNYAVTATSGTVSHTQTIAITVQ